MSKRNETYKGVETLKDIGDQVNKLSRQAKAPKKWLHATSTYVGCDPLLFAEGGTVNGPFALGGEISSTLEFFSELRQFCAPATRSFETIYPSAGLWALVASAGGGKSTWLRGLAARLASAKIGEGHVKVLVGGEPEYTQATTIVEVAEGKREQSDPLLTFLSAVDANAERGDLLLVDSLADLMFVPTRPGEATFPGGVSAAYVEALRDLDAALAAKGILCIAVLNPLLADSPNLRSTIAAKTSGIVQLDGASVGLVRGRDDNGAPLRYAFHISASKADGTNSAFESFVSDLIPEGGVV